MVWKYFVRRFLYDSCIDKNNQGLILLSIQTSIKKNFSSLGRVGCASYLWAINYVYWIYQNTSLNWLPNLNINSVYFIEIAIKMFVYLTKEINK